MMTSSDEYALLGATLIDGSGGPPLKDSAVVVKNARIIEVAERKVIRLREGVQTLDLTGLFLLPGLIDCHIHFIGVSGWQPIDWITESNYMEAIRAVAEVRAVLEHGFTTVRSAGSRYDLHLRRAISEGTIPGPRIRACGLGPCRSSGHGDPVPRDLYDIPEDWVRSSLPWAQPCDGVEDLRKLIRRLIGQNVDHIKFWATGGGFWSRDRMRDSHYSVEEMTVIVEEAHMFGLRVMCHAENMEAIRKIVDLGVDSIEHGDNEEGQELDAEICKKMADKNIFLCPTIGVNFAEPDCMEKLPEPIVAGYQRAHSLGVKIIAGSDSYAAPVTPYGISSSRELGCLVEVLEFTPMEAIIAATKHAAQACELDEVTGSIEVGKYADMIVIRRDPLSDIHALEQKQNLVYVFKEGRPMFEGSEISRGEDR
ncbi:MAG: amidohydrolase family protein [Spirochaetaceae bacterium]|nr:MAG: amidohydrolase family protein [Spirochaetaceae bacterium]